MVESHLHEIMDLVNSLVGYTTNDVLYRWNDRAVAISEDLKMSQFDLISVPSSNGSYKIEKEVEGRIYSE